MSTDIKPTIQRTSYAPQNRVGNQSTQGNRIMSTGPVRRSGVSRPAFEREEEHDNPGKGDRYDRRPHLHEDFEVCIYKNGKQIMNDAETARYLEFYDQIFNEGTWFRVKRYDTGNGWGFTIEWFGRDIRLAR